MWPTFWALFSLHLRRNLKFSRMHQISGGLKTDHVLTLPLSYFEART